MNIMSCDQKCSSSKQASKAWEWTMNIKGWWTRQKPIPIIILFFVEKWIQQKFSISLYAHQQHRELISSSFKKQNTTRFFRKYFWWCSCVQFIHVVIAFPSSIHHTMYILNVFSKKNQARHHTSQYTAKGKQENEKLNIL